ncbi:putative E3 ubiquitin-protein ligase Topors-like [Scophthalmus maximus]|uniref:E3 ubiquitin-protein ligase Topors n=1 Tax=Scophthalmus maximus TaxID=52904 RepID=A0A2U9B081_SCOMX|nr:putative E3 ubiquitin-protein ligase Topors-like [Scophthalmus maximus]
MPLTVRKPAGRRRKKPDEKLPERPGESTSAQVMATTRMKLRVRRRDGAAAGSDRPAEEEQRSQESGGGGRSSSRRKNTSNAATAAPAAASPPPPASTPPPPPPPPPTSSATARTLVAAEDASPDSKCPICLDRFNNLAYLDRCLHRFCFPCIQEWSHNKAECPLCKQPFASILHSVRAEDDFKETTLRPPPANSSVAAAVAMVAAMASAARSDHQMRLMLRRHRTADSGDATTRRRRRERGGRASRRAGVLEWYLDSPRLPLPPLPHHAAVSPVVAEDSVEGEDLDQQRMRGVADLAEGVIFEGLTGLGGAGTHNVRASRLLMTRLVTRQRLQREGRMRRLREREAVGFRRSLYRCGIRVRGAAGVVGNQGQQCDITAESFRRNPTHLNRLRPWLQRELTVLYGAHSTLVDIVQRIIMAQLARHGLEDSPTIEEELRPFLLARTDHFLHELVNFARSPLSLENYDLQAVYEPPAAALELDGRSSPSDGSSVIAISEGEEEESWAGGRLEERRQGRASGAHNDVTQKGRFLTLSDWDDETPGPSYSTAEPACSFSPAPQEAANEGEGGEGGEGEEECLIVGYKKPIAERTPELVQLSSDTEKEEEEEKTPQLPTTTPPPPPSCLPTIPPSTSGAFPEEQDEKPKEKDGNAGERRSRARSWSASSGRSRESVCTLSPKDRSPSVEIIYEGTIDSEAAQPPAAKRRRRRRRRTQHSSSPVIITLDSDSSHDDDDLNKTTISSSSSSPLSSQQTVDFSDLPPLPMVHSAGVGGALDAEIGELPVDILDRGSDGSEAEPPGRSEVAVDNSDQDVDVEHDEDGGSPLGCDVDDRGASLGTRGPIRGVDKTTASDPRGATSEDGNDSVPSDSRLLATILDDLRGIAAPRCDLSLNYDARKVRSRVRADHGSWSSELERKCNEAGDQKQGSDLPTPAPPPPLHQMAFRVGEEAVDVPPLLKQASPVRSHHRNTPPPLKHKDAGSPHLSPTDRLSPGSSVVDLDSNPVSEPPKENRTIPPISSLRKHLPSSSTFRGFHSSRHKPPAGSRSPSASENNSTSADSLPHLNSFHSSTEYSSCDVTEDTPPSALRASPVDVRHPVNSSPPVVDFCSAVESGWSREKGGSTSARRRNEASFSPAAPVDPRLSGNSGAGGKPAFSGVNSNNASPPLSVSSVESRTRNLSPADPSASEGLTDGTTLAAAGDHEDESPRDLPPPVDLHRSRPSPPANTLSFRSIAALTDALTDGHANHLASPSSAAFHSSRPKRSSQSEPADSDTTLHNNFAPVDPKLNVRDLVASAPRPLENPWNSNAINARSDARSPAGRRSPSSVWTTHAHTVPRRTHK